MADLTDKELDAALERGRVTRRVEPRATCARFDPREGRVIVELANGCAFAFPPGLAQGLEGAADEVIATVEVIGAGHGLHWKDLDVDLSIPGLLAGVFGSARHMAGRGGRARSPAKAAAARANGAKGGRPRKISAVP